MPVIVTRPQEIDRKLHRIVLEAKGKEFPRRLRPVVATILLLCGLGISSFGLIELIDKGYGTISWGVLLVFVVPLFTIGIYKMTKKK